MTKHYAPKTGEDRDAQKIRGSGSSLWWMSQPVRQCNDGTALPYAVVRE